MLSPVTAQQPEALLPPDAVRVLVVDAHDPSRLGFGLLLQRESWVERCLLAATVERAAELALRHRPTVAVLDVGIGGPGVAAAVATLRAAHRPMRVVLSTRSDVVGGMQHQVGASAVLPPNVTAPQVVSAVRSAVLEETPSESPPRRLPGLSEREERVLRLMAVGLTNPEIAAELRIGAESVKKHASSLYRKLEVRNRTEAAQRAAVMLGTRVRDTD